mmetsp:Transcript_10837/g.23182  ORF Transcript_10837/g.23182 Transcript_10837/m.23182 type:complete len:827 (-) Transcript_10837:680-3160(-)
MNSFPLSMNGDHGCSIGRPKSHLLDGFTDERSLARHHCFDQSTILNLFVHLGDFVAVVENQPRDFAQVAHRRRRPGKPQDVPFVQHFREWDGGKRFDGRCRVRNGVRTVDAHEVDSGQLVDSGLRHGLTDVAGRLGYLHGGEEFALGLIRGAMGRNDFEVVPHGFLCLDPIRSLDVLLGRRRVVCGGIVWLKVVSGSDAEAESSVLLRFVILVKLRGRRIAQCRVFAQLQDQLITDVQNDRRHGFRVNSPVRLLNRHDGGMVNLSEANVGEALSDQPSVTNSGADDLQTALSRGLYSRSFGEERLQHQPDLAHVLVRGVFGGLAPPNGQGPAVPHGGFRVAEFQLEAGEALGNVQQQSGTIGRVDGQHHQVLVFVLGDDGSSFGRRQRESGIVGRLAANGVLHLEYHAHAFLVSGIEQTVQGASHALKARVVPPFRVRSRRRRVQRSGDLGRGSVGGEGFGERRDLVAIFVALATAAALPQPLGHLVRHHLQAVLLAKLAERVDQSRKVQNVVHFQNELRRHRRVHVPRRSPLDADEVNPARVPQSAPLDRPARRGRPLRQTRPQEDVLRMGAGGGRASHSAVAASPGQKRGSHQNHVRHPHQRHGHAVRTEGEEGHVLELLLVGIPLEEQPHHDEIGGRADDGAHPSQQRRERQGHQHVSRMQFDLPGPLDHDGQRDGDERSVVDESRQHHDGEHDPQLRPRKSRGSPEEFAHVPVERSGLVQSLGHHEEDEDGEEAEAVEALEGLGDGDDAGEVEDSEGGEHDGVGADAVQDEDKEHDGEDEDGEDGFPRFWGRLHGVVGGGGHCCSCCCGCCCGCCCCCCLGC